MAILDASNNAVVIRVVYDGAPFAGKTTSVGALGRGLGAAVHSPAEINGRTLYFDWLDYTGGLFEGHRIRCQIVSVPGQASLASRRQRLLESADVVVFVGDSSPAGFEADHAHLRGLGSQLGKLSGPPVGIVLQANKRDLPDAVPLDRMRAMLDDIGMKIGIVETVAKDGTGIREAFVFAVRLALDRVRELMRSGELVSGPPIIGTADDLLADLRGQESAEAGGTMATEALEQALRSETEGASAVTAVPSLRTAPAVRGQPALPSEEVASGLVWPPVDGRVILQEISRSPANLRCSDDGAWYGRIGTRWQVLALADAVFDTVDEGRPALIALARAYATKCRADAVERCAALASDGAGRVRLWRIKRIGI